MLPKRRQVGPIIVTKTQTHKSTFRETAPQPLVHSAMVGSWWWPWEGDQKTGRSTESRSDVGRHAARLDRESSETRESRETERDDGAVPVERHQSDIYLNQSESQSAYQSNQLISIRLESGTVGETGPDSRLARVDRTVRGPACRVRGLYLSVDSNGVLYRNARRSRVRVAHLTQHPDPGSRALAQPCPMSQPSARTPAQNHRSA